MNDNVDCIHGRPLFHLRGRDIAYYKLLATVKLIVNNRKAKILIVLGFNYLVVNFKRIIAVLIACNLYMYGKPIFFRKPYII